MEFDFRPETGLYITAAVLGVITVLYFGSEYIFQLSPVTKSAVIFSMFLFSFALSLWIPEDEKIYSIISQGIGGIAYLVFLAYTLSKFSLDQNQIFLSLAVSAAIFAAIGRLLSTGKLKVEGEKIRKTILSVLTVLALLLVFDAVGGQPDYELQLEEQVELESGEEAVLGSIKVTNEFILPRQVETHSYSACIPEDRERRIYLSHSVDELVGGNEAKSYNLTASIPYRDTENISGSFQVQESGSCPETGSETIFVFSREGTTGIVD